MEYEYYVKKFHLFGKIFLEFCQTLRKNIFKEIKPDLNLYIESWYWGGVWSWLDIHTN